MQRFCTSEHLKRTPILSVYLVASQADFEQIVFSARHAADASGIESICCKLQKRKAYSGRDAPYELLAAAAELRLRLEENRSQAHQPAFVSRDSVLPASKSKPLSQQAAAASKPTGQKNLETGQRPVRRLMTSMTASLPKDVPQSGEAISSIRQGEEAASLSKLSIEEPLERGQSK